MGADCCNESKSDQNIVAGATQANTAAGGSETQEAPKKAAKAQKDLPAISGDGKDVYEKFELSLPFYRCHIDTFGELVEQAHEACGNQNWVNITELAKVFTTPAWAQLT